VIGLFTRLVPLAVASAAISQNGDEIKNLGSHLLNIANNLRASAEMRSISKSIRLDMISGEEFPQDIVDYARRRMDSQGQDPSKDPWSKEYLLIEAGDGKYLVSLGPDGELDTDDDIAVRIVGRDGRFNAKDY